MNGMKGTLNNVHPLLCPQVMDILRHGHTCPTFFYFTEGSNNWKGGGRNWRQKDWQSEKWPLKWNQQINGRKRRGKNFTFRAQKLVNESDTLSVQWMDTLDTTLTMDRERGSEMERMKVETDFLPIETHWREGFSFKWWLWIVTFSLFCIFSVLHFLYSDNSFIHSTF